jgi:hypothetical protein
MNRACGAKPSTLPVTAVVEASADTDDQVGLVHGHVGFERAMHAEHAEERGIGRRERAQAKQGQRARSLGRAHETGERTCRRPDPN